MERLKDEKGVTLIELLAVVVILAIIAAVAIPTVMGQITKSKINADQSTESIIVDALTRAEFDYQSTGSTSNSIFFNSISMSNVVNGYGNLINATGAARVWDGSSSTNQTVTDLLENGYNNGTKDTGRGFLSGINPPNTGSNWRISATDPDNSTSNTVPSALDDKFTFASDSGGNTSTFWLYPVQ